MKHNGIHKRITAVIIAVLMTAMLAGCATYDNFKHSFIEDKAQSGNEVIYIGVFEPQSGELEQQGREEIKGIELANSIYSNVQGVEIHLIEVDNQSDPAAAKGAIQDLLDMEPVAIIGSAGEANSMIASPYIKEAKIPTITPSATNPLITNDNEYYFRACITDTQRGAGLAEYAKDVAPDKTIGIVNIENNSAIEAVSEGFEKKTAELGRTGKIAFRMNISVDHPSVNNILTQIKEKKVGVVYLPVGAEVADAVFDRIESEGLTDIVFLGTKEWANEDFVSMMQYHPQIKIGFPYDTVISGSGFTTGTNTVEAQNFLIEYANKYGYNDTPTQNAVLGYDSYLILVSAINNADSTSPEDIRKAIAATNDLRCATGTFTFDSNGSPIRTVNIATIKGGEVVTEYVTNTKQTAGEMKHITR